MEAVRNDLVVSLKGVRNAIHSMTLGNRPNDENVNNLRSVWKEVEEGCKRNVQLEEIKVEYQMMAAENQVLKMRLKELSRSHPRPRNEEPSNKEESVKNHLPTLSSRDDVPNILTRLDQHYQSLTQLFDKVNESFQSSELASTIIERNQQVLSDVQNNYLEITSVCHNNALLNSFHEQENIYVMEKCKGLESQIQTLKQELKQTQFRYENIARQNYALQSGNSDLQMICLMQDKLLRSKETECMSKEDKHRIADSESSAPPVDENGIYKKQTQQTRDILPKLLSPAKRNPPQASSLLQTALRELGNIPYKKRRLQDNST